MKLLQEDIFYLAKRIKGIAFDLNMAKAIKMMLYIMIIVAAIAICVLVGLVITDIPRFTFTDIVVSVIVFGAYVWWIWFMSPLIIEEYNKEIIDLEKQKIECERDIEKYKNDMIALREMEKKIMKSKLTENQIKTLNKSQNIKKVKWQLVENNDGVKTYEFKIDKKRSLWIDEIDGESCNVFFGATKIAEYSSLKTAKKGVETIIKNITKAWTLYNS